MTLALSALCLVVGAAAMLRFLRRRHALDVLLAALAVALAAWMLTRSPIAPLAAAALVSLPTTGLLLQRRHSRDPMAAPVDRELRAIATEASGPKDILFHRTNEFRDRLIALGEAAAPALTAAVTGRVERRSDFVQVPAIQALGEIGDRSTAERFEELFDRPETDWLMRSYLLAALIRIEPRHGLARVRRMLEEGAREAANGEAEDAGAVAVESTGEPTDPRLDEAAPTAPGTDDPTPAAPSLPAPTATDQAEQLLGTASTALSRASEAAPYEVREEVFELLLRFLEAPAGAARKNAAVGLGRLGDVKAKGALLVALGDERNRAFAGAIGRAVLASGGRSEDLLGVWARLSTEARRDLVEQLARVEPEERRELFGIFQAAMWERDERLDRGVLRACRELRDRSATRLLLALLRRSEDPAILKGSLEALLDRGEIRQVAAIWDELEPLNRSTLLQSLTAAQVETRRAEVVALLGLALADEEPEVAAVAAERVADLDLRELAEEVRRQLPRLQHAEEEADAERAARALEGMPEMADFAVRTTESVFGRTLTWDAASIALLDEVIDQGWPDGGVILGQTLATFAAYLGETVRRLHGGHWQVTDEGELRLCDIGCRAIELRPMALIEARFERPREARLQTAYEELTAALAEGRPAVIG